MYALICCDVKHQKFFFNTFPGQSIACQGIRSDTCMDEKAYQ